MSSERVLSFSIVVAAARGKEPRLDLTLALPVGITRMVGPSGAGKSTCLLALAGLVRPVSGHIELAGRTLFDARRAIDVPTRDRRVALLFQSLALFPHMTVAQNVAFGLARTLTEHERAERARAWLSRMQVAGLAERHPATLSGGEAQRVALARALASEPRLLLLDEPFSALDQALRVELSRELEREVATLGIPALLVTHDTASQPAPGGPIVRLAQGRRSD
jgi:molybdate transport system ATP-binding protein